MSVAVVPEQIVLLLPDTLAVTGALTEILTAAVSVQEPLDTTTE